MLTNSLSKSNRAIEGIAEVGDLSHEITSLAAVISPQAGVRLAWSRASNGFGTVPPVSPQLEYPNSGPSFFFLVHLCSLVSRSELPQIRESP